MRSKDSCPVLRGLEDSNVFRLPDSALEQEHLRVILLDRRNRILETVEVYKGSVNSSQVRVGEVFKEAVRKNASAVIVIHNHPSGDPTPSPVIWRKSQGKRKRFVRAIVSLRSPYQGCYAALRITA